MKRILTGVVVVGVGLTVLAGYMFPSRLAPVLNLIIDWGVLLLGAAVLIGVGYLLRMHIHKLVRPGKGWFTSLVALLAFGFTLIAGLALTSQDPFFVDLVLNIQVPVEASLLGILAVVLLYASLRFIRTQGWTPMSIGFFSSAILSLLLNLGYAAFNPGTIASELVTFLRRLPIAGARGVLIGMALGGLIVAMRVLLTIDRPYGE